MFLGQFGHILIVIKTPDALEKNLNWIGMIEPLWDDHPNQVNYLLTIIKKCCVCFGVLDYVLGQFGHILIIIKTPDALEINLNRIGLIEPLWGDHPNQVH